MSKRILPVLVVLLAGSLALYAGGQGEDTEGGEAATPETMEVMDTSIKEAPMLAEQVAAGELPPLEERIPEDPLVVEPFDSLGEYGGTLRLSKPGTVGNPTPSNQTSLAIYDPQLQEIIPNLASSWEVLNEGREFIINLRPGTKWSDGEPFTADDILFYVNDIALNEELNPAGPPGWLNPGGSPVEVEKIDDYTIKFSFDVIHGLFIHDLASYWSYAMTRAPKHYLQQFHPNYVDQDELDAMVDEADFEDWIGLFENRWDVTENSNPDRPTLGTHMLTQAPPNDPMVMVRNPYFWAVDTEGRQLPYIDQVNWPLVDDREVHQMRVVAGEVDFDYRLDAANLPLFKQNEADSNFTTYTWTQDMDSQDLLCLNLSHPEPAMRELFGNPQFRIAVSHAINRSEINELVYQGLCGDPSQPGPPEGSVFYNPDLNNAYLEYDPELTKSMFDEIGLPVGPDGMRQLPNGEPLQVNFLIAANQGNVEPVTELFVDYLKDVGISANMRAIERGAWFTAIQTNEFDATVWWGNPASNYLPDPRNLVAYKWYTSFWAPHWAVWFDSEGEEGIEPPEAMKEARRLYDQAVTTTDKQEQIRLSEQITDIAAENLWVIGTNEPPPQPVVVHNRLKNVPEDVLSTWDTRERVVRMYQWWIDQ